MSGASKRHISSTPIKGRKDIARKAIYENGGEPPIPTKKGARFERRCDW